MPPRGRRLRRRHRPSRRRRRRRQRRRRRGGRRRRRLVRPPRGCAVAGASASRRASRCTITAVPRDGVGSGDVSCPPPAPAGAPPHASPTPRSWELRRTPPRDEPAAAKCGRGSRATARRSRRVRQGARPRGGTSPGPAEPLLVRGGPVDTRKRRKAGSRGGSNNSATRRATARPRGGAWCRVVVSSAEAVGAAAAAGPAAAAGRPRDGARPPGGALGGHATGVTGLAWSPDGNYRHGRAEGRADPVRGTPGAPAPPLRDAPGVRAFEPARGVRRRAVRAPPRDRRVTASFARSTGGTERGRELAGGEDRVSDRAFHPRRRSRRRRGAVARGASVSARGGSDPGSSTRRRREEEGAG